LESGRVALAPPPAGFSYRFPIFGNCQPSAYGQIIICQLNDD